MRSLLHILVVLLLGYAVLLGLLYVFQSRLIYFPNVAAAHSDARPTDMGLRYEDVAFRTSDSLELHGWFVPADEPRAVLLFMHGNAGNITHRLDSIALFNRLGLSVFIFDYRGYGKSEGTPSESGTYEDAGAAWRYLTGNRSIAAERIVLFGRSLGAAIAAQLASRTRPAALILESAFTSAPDVAARHYWYFPVRLLSRFDYDTKAYVAESTCPLIVVHSPYDEIIPFEHGEAIFAAASEPKAFLRISGSHNEGFLASGPVYVDGLRAFLDRHLPGASP